MAFIIVKYREHYYPKNAKVSKSLAYAGYTCILAGIDKSKIYSSMEEAEKDLKVLRKLNPSVGFGIIETY